MPRRGCPRTRSKRLRACTKIGIGRHAGACGKERHAPRRQSSSLGTRIGHDVTALAGQLHPSVAPGPRAWGEAIVNAESEAAQPRCPTCGGPLVGMGSREIGISEAALHRRHAYWCQAGCCGPEPDGMFEFTECPACGSHDTSSTPRGDGVEEVECSACGTITTLQMVPSTP